MNRFRTIDLCRGLLFIFMMNTHALSIAGVPSSHWLLSDLWLPNGWATLVFVVLSGYGVGFLFSTRLSIVERDVALRRRSRQILAIMLVSNTVFAALRDIVGGKHRRIDYLRLVDRFHHAGHGLDNFRRFAADRVGPPVRARHDRLDAKGPLDNTCDASSCSSRHLGRRHHDW